MNINELKKNLRNSTKEELIKDVVNIFKMNEFAKDYFCSKYSNDSNTVIFTKHKNIIESEFFPKRGFGDAKLAAAKKAITEFKKLSSNKALIAELMFFYVEMGVKYTNCYGDINESFYSNVN